MLAFDRKPMAKKAKPENEPDRHAVSATLGGFIRAQREMANLSLRQLSGMAEISNAYLSQIERDLHEPSIRVLNSVGKALGLSPETLLARAGLATEDPGRESARTTNRPPTTEEAIEADPYLSADEKQALLTVYRSDRSAKG